MSLSLICEGSPRPILDLVIIPGYPVLSPVRQPRDCAQWLAVTASKRLPNVRCFLFRHTLAQDQDHFSWNLVVEEDCAALLSNLRSRRQLDGSRPILFMCQSFGSFIVKKSLLVAQNTSYRQILESTRGAIFIGCLHDETVSDFDNYCIRSAMAETNIKGDKARAILMNADNLKILKTINEAFRELNQFSVVTYYEGKPTPYRVGPFHRDKLQVLCPRHAATLGWANERVECVEMDHVHLSGSPRHDSQFSRSLITSLIEMTAIISSDPGGSPSAFTAPQMASLFARLPRPDSRPSERRPVKTPCHMVLPSLNPSFTGRKETLATMTSKLVQQLQTVTSGSSSLARSYAICGLGGAGKSQLALKFCQDHLSAFPVAVWVPAEERTKIIDCFIKVAVALGIVDSRSRAWEEAWGMLKQWLSETDIPWLLIFDNADSENNKQLLSEFLPNGRRGSIIITSRDKTLLGEFDGIDIPMLETAPALELLMELTAKHRSQKLLDESEERQAAEQILLRVDCLPIAIQQVANIVVNDLSSLSQFLKYYDVKSLIEDSRSSKTVHDARINYRHSLSTIWDIEFERIEDQSRILLNAISLLDPDLIQPELLESGVNSSRLHSLGFPSSWPKYRKAFGSLLRKNLIYEMSSRDFWIHRVVRESCQIRIGSDERGRAFRLAFGLIQDVFPIPSASERHDRSIWPQQQKYLAHIQSLSDFYDQNHDTSQDLGVDGKEFANVLHAAAWHLYERGIFEPAFPLLSIAIKSCQQSSNCDDILAAVYHIQGSIQTESNMFHAAYESFKKHLSHLEAALDSGLLKRPNIMEVYALGGLGNGLQGLNRYAEAEEYYRKCIGEFAKGFPGKLFSSSVAEVNLGTCLWLQGKLDQAETLLSSLITDPEDSTSYRTGHALFALGNVQLAQADELSRNGQPELAAIRLQEAYETHTRTLRLFKQTLGSRHHKVGDVYHKLACHHHRRNDYTAAITNLTLALDIYKQSRLFKNEVARSTYKLGLVYQDQGNAELSTHLMNCAEALRREIIRSWPAESIDEGENESVTGHNEQAFDRLVMFWSR